MSKYWVGLGEVGFWDQLVDGDLRQRRDINSALESSEQVASELGELARHVNDLHQKVFDLQIMNTVLLKMLGEGGQVDLKTLRYRVEAEVDAMKADQQARREKPPTMPATITCPRCQRAVPPNQTTMTADGVVCDACLR